MDKEAKNMYEIVKKHEIGYSIYDYEIYAPDVAISAKAGQFIIFRINSMGERIPITIVETKPEKGLVRIIFQKIGKSTFQLASLNKGDYIRDFLGPLGNPTKIKKYGNVVVIGGGIGVAGILSIVKEFKKIGNTIIIVVGARSKNLLILESELRQYSDSIFFATNDGSYGIKGFVTDILKDIVSKNKIDIVYAIGPVIMMKAVSEFTKKKCIKTIVSLNPIMLDGTGICGACRVTVAGETKFVCVDGPEFDAHSVNWNELYFRLESFKYSEKISLDRFKQHMGCVDVKKK
ncbi:MAG: sulfide/dihydroorotate dehydrogenase-like FAD/NAD-binding protein [Endomicrobium sp.]|jgi:ferredoxin--NADP+ reductase|nr:sulfide/dihydroorotate dehydrogenase-like FAD/NAD-binding protein [Endomicrobium sp.]